jgi:type IV pilus assembly protein PilV
MQPAIHPGPSQAGFSLIEVLVAILLLSIGILALSTTLSYAVQMPKLSGYHAAAVNLASSYVERMRANTDGFAGGAYDQGSSYDGLRSPQARLPTDSCAYPTCNANTMASMDFADLKVAVRAELPAGGALMLRDSQSGVASSSEGNLWIVWQEPSTFALLSPFTSDNCPTAISSNFSDPAPRCLYLRFRL